MPGSFGLQWHITNRCDQKCKHCYIFNSGQNVRLNDFKIDDVDEVITKFINFCHNNDKRPSISITGGDPILHPNFWEIIEKVYKSNISFEVL